MINEEILKRLKEIEERTAKATPGPWVARYAFVFSQPTGRTVMEYDWLHHKPDLDFILHAREDVPWLLQLVKKLLTVAEAARKLIAQHEVDGYRHTEEGLMPVIREQELLDLKEALAALERKHG